jgi:hypothetical protein
MVGTAFAEDARFARPNDADTLALPEYTNRAGSVDSIIAGHGDRRDRSVTGEANDTRRNRYVWRTRHPAATQNTWTRSDRSRGAHFSHLQFGVGSLSEDANATRIRVWRDRLGTEPAPAGKRDDAGAMQPALGIKVGK